MKNKGKKGKKKEVNKKIEEKEVEEKVVEEKVEEKIEPAKQPIPEENKEEPMCTPEKCGMKKRCACRHCVFCLPLRILLTTILLFVSAVLYLIIRDVRLLSFCEQ